MQIQPIGCTQNRSIEFIPAATIQQIEHMQIQPIEHVQTNAQIEQTTNQVPPNPSTPQRPIEQIQTNEVEYNRVPPLMYIQPTAQRQIEHMQTNEVEYNRVAPLTYIQPTVQRPIEQTMNKPIEFNQAAPLAHKHPNTQQQTIQNIPNTIQVAAVDNQPRKYNRSIGFEEKSYFCSWCETPTKFADHKKLGKHIERFHLAFNQKNKGTKRGNDDLDEIAPKRIRWNVTGIPGDDEYIDDDNEEGSENDTDEGYDIPQIRFG